jgi:hypothetical protein
MPPCILKVRIKSHRNGCTYSQPHFFVSNKGMNTGKPFSISCPNCFVVIAKDETEKEFYYWLSFGLWRSKYFHPCLCGSVIPFIVISDYTATIKEGANRAEFEKSLKALSFLGLKEKQFHENLRLIQDAKRAIFRKALRY